MQSYEFLVERISKSSGLEKAEIEKRIEAKRAKLSGLISKEGAAQIIAAELGINFEESQLKVQELMPGMKRVNIIGQIINLFPVKEYNKNNKQGKIGSMILADDSGNVRVVLWDTNHIDLIERQIIKQGDVLEIRNAAMRENELHLSSFSELKKSNLVLNDIKTERSVVSKNIENIQQGQSVKIRGIVVQMFAPKFFVVCPQCNKKVIPEADGHVCAEHGKVIANERCLVNFVLDDGTETIRVTLFSDQIGKLFSGDLKNPENIISFREDLLGTELNVSGVVRKNQMFNNLEINVNDVERVDVEKLIEELEKN
jgi:ssDNA-binding replication factor A large subunit